MKARACYNFNMAAIMRKGVGLLIVTRVSGIGKVAVLQVRGLFNTEEMRPQYYSGGSQVTVYGGIKRGESPRKALAREAREELGAAVAGMLIKARLAKVAEFRRANEEGIIYAARLPSVFLKKIRLGPDSGGIRLATLNDLRNAQNLSNYKEGVRDTRTLAVFPDTKKAAVEAFKILDLSTSDVDRLIKKPGREFGLIC